ncbi:MAG: glucose-6-phosphate dehydrogenase assembly protein OpcA [Candidatus Velthaea sp.]
MTANSPSSGDMRDVRADLATTCVRATTMNFMVWLDNAQHRDWILDAAGKIAEKHPSRSLIFDPSSHACGVTLPHGDGADDTVQNQRVAIGCDGMSPAELLEAAQPLLSAELPTVLWWTGNPFQRRAAFDALVGLADGLVLNSSGTVADESMVQELARFVARCPGVALRDIAWMRLRPWQDMIAQFFDDENLCGELFAVRKLCIEAGSDAEALYLAGWLGSRLGWTACAHDEFCDRGGAPIPFRRVREGDIRRVRSIQISTASSAYTATVNDADQDVIVLTATGAAARPERLVLLQSIDNASLLERAILEPATDEVFETALRMVGELLA